MGQAEEFTFEGEGRTHTGLWAVPDQHTAVAVVAHGANNDMRHAFFEGVSEGLVEGGIAALRFNFPYKDAGRSYPDRPRTLMESWQAALAEARRRSMGRPIVASGKSLGGRMASMVAAEYPDRWPANGLVFFGYPLHAPGQTDALRDGNLLWVPGPMLFIEGTHDSLARFDLISGVVERLGDRATMHVVEGGDHSFRVKGHKRPDDEIGRELGGVAATFIRDQVVARDGRLIPARPQT
jgi:predicted alpha/beta-hydrolase family hydrolase